MSIRCYKCKAQLPDEAKFCNKCGASLVPVEKFYCPNCKSEIKNKDAKFCMKCGMAFEGDIKPETVMVDSAPYVCGQCGNVLDDKNAKFCSKCGNKFEENNKPLRAGNEENYYRACTYCGKTYEFDPFENSPKICRECGHQLDMVLRMSPELTEEEEKAVDERKEKERQQKIEEQRKAIEEQKKRQLEEKEELKRKADEAIRIKEKRRKILKTIGKIAGVIIGITAVILIVWHCFNGSNIEKAEAALAAGDYNSAVKYYSYVMPLSPVRKECDEKAEKIAEAGEIYETALEKYNSYSYVDAATQAKKAMDICPELKLSEELYGKAINGLDTYLKKQYDAGEYGNVYKTITELDENYVTENMKTILNSLNTMITNYVSTGRQQFNEFKMDEALKSANAALAIAPDNEYAQSVKSDVLDYKEYKGDIEKSVAAYNRGDYNEAKYYYYNIKNTTPGYKVKGEYETYIAKLNTDLEYVDNPVRVSGKSSNAWYTDFHLNDRAELSFTLTNRISRPVEVRVELKYNNDTEYRTYTLSGYESRSISETMYDIYVYRNQRYTYNVTIDDFEIE